MNDQLRRRKGIEMTQETMRMLAEFGAWCLARQREDFADLDGWEIQEEAEAMGLLVRVPVTEACGDDCACAESGEFPTQCLRPTEDVWAMMRPYVG